MEQRREKYYPSAKPWSSIIKDVTKRTDSSGRTDMVLIVKNEGDDQVERFPVLSTWLTLRSPGLDRAIEDLGPSSNELFLPNVSPHTLRQALHFIRVGSWEKQIKDDDDLFGLVKFNSQYQSSGLLERCLMMLKRRLKARNAINIWKKSIELNLQNLKDTALAFILQNANAIFGTDDFLLLTIQELAQLLEKDELNASEIDALEAVVKWGKHCFRQNGNADIQAQQEHALSPTPEQLRAVIHPLISLIRFTLISRDALFQTVQPLHILTDPERLEIYEYILAPAELKPSIIFNTKHRIFSLRGTSENSMDVDINPQPQVTPTTTLDRVQNDMQNLIIASSSVFHQISQQYSNRRLIAPPVVPVTLPNAASTQQFSSEFASNQIPFNVNPRKARVKSEDQSTNQSPDSSAASMFYDKQNCVYHSWEEFVRHFDDHPENVLHSTYKIRLQNVSFLNNYTYQTVVLPNLQKISLDLSIDVSIGPEDADESFMRFEKSFDIRRYLFYRRSSEDLMDLTQLWDSKMPINIVINGVTMLRLNTEEMELAIGFRSDYFSILSGVGRGEHLQKLCLMKTDVPDIKEFPCKHLKEVLFYHVFALTEFDVKKFVRRCSFLESFCCWVICPWWENMTTSSGKNPLYSPTELDLTKDFVSNDKLKYVALCKVLLTLTTPPKQAVKVNLTELFLDTCYWEDTFVDNFDKLFPSLKRCAFRQQNQKIRPKNPQELYKSSVSIRLLHKILNLTHIEWVRIWGLNWDERYVTEVREGSKQLRSTVAPITYEEVSFVKSFLERCNVPADSDNFTLIKNLASGEWTANVFNEEEMKELDFGFWNTMDELDFEYYKLRNFFKDYKCVQNHFHINLGLPP